MPPIPIRGSINASRICLALAKIGYSSDSAIMDIVDNSIEANATRVLISLELDPNKTYAAGNNIVKYRILDNGYGMSNEQIIQAFTLGATADNYGQNSLSKYGLGLKSAGLSLGSKISVLSKNEGQISSLYYIDLNQMPDDYTIYQEEPSDEQNRCLTDFLNDCNAGTLVEIDYCLGISTMSARKLVDRLNTKLGVTYYPFLNREDAPLSLKIRCSGRAEINIQGFDILFSSIARPNFDPENYDFVTPCLVLRQNFPVPPAPDIRIEAVIFPRDAVANQLNLTAEQKDLVKSYMVGKNNKGFFIYRNNRLIRWGDDIEGIIDKDNLGFRGRMFLSTAHDDVLHVDVSKQRLSIPEEILERIKVLLRIPLRQSVGAFDLCSAAIKRNKPGQTFNDNNKDVAEEDIEEEIIETKPDTTSEEKRRRKAIIEKKTKQSLEEAGEIQEDKEPETQPPQIPAFQKVRYSGRVRSGILWDTGRDPSDGTFIRINENHTYYQAILQHMPEGSPERQAIEGLLWCFGVGENMTLAGMSDIDFNLIERIIDRFKKTVATNLDTWSGNNENLFHD